MEDDRPFKLVIVESPSKCQTISKILQAYVKENKLDYDFVLTSSLGHVRDLPKKKTDKDQKIAGIDLDNDYRPTYVVLEGKEALLSELDELSSYAQQLILATDDDREGEAMAWHLLQILDGSNNKHNAPPIRVRFTEITPKAIVDAIEHSEPNLRDNLVQAQETRRILDRLAGFTLSPILAKKIVSDKGICWWNRLLPFSQCTLTRMVSQFLFVNQTHTYKNGEIVSRIVGGKSAIGWDGNDRPTGKRAFDFSGDRILER
jgi:DNA topoisomerase IA